MQFNIAMLCLGHCVSRIYECESLTLTLTLECLWPHDVYDQHDHYDALCIRIAWI